MRERESEEGGSEGGGVKTDFLVNVFGCVSTTLCVSVSVLEENACENSHTLVLFHFQLVFGRWLIDGYPKVSLSQTKKGLWYSFLPPSLPPLAPALPHSLPPSLIPSRTPSLPPSFPHALPPSLPHSLTHSLPPSLPPLAPSLPHSLTHSLPPSLIPSRTPSLPSSPP